MSISGAGTRKTGKTSCLFSNGSTGPGRATIWFRRIRAGRCTAVRFLHSTGNNSGAGFTKPDRRPAVTTMPGRPSCVPSLGKINSGKPLERSSREGLMKTCLLRCIIFIITGMMMSLAFPADSVARDADDPGRRLTIVHQGIKRSCKVQYPPALLTGDKRVPLVLVLHGGGGNADNAEKMTGFTQKALSGNFIVAYPEGTGRFGKLLTWNAGHCCGWAMKQGVDD